MKDKFDERFWFCGSIHLIWTGKLSYTNLRPMPYTSTFLFGLSQLFDDVLGISLFVLSICWLQCFTITFADCYFQACYVSSASGYWHCTDMQKCWLHIAVFTNENSTHWIAILRKLGFHWTNFREIWYRSKFRFSVDKVQVSWKYYNNNVYFTITCTLHEDLCTVMTLSRFCLEWDIFQGIVVGKIEKKMC